MNTYKVTYYYLATGMEGRADARDYGNVQASTPEEAIDVICKSELSNCTFSRSCLTATLVKGTGNVFWPVFGNTDKEDTIDDLPKPTKEKMITRPRMSGKTALWKQLGELANRYKVVEERKKRILEDIDDLKIELSETEEELVELEAQANALL